MRIIIAIDSFKGCVDSLSAGEAAARGFREVLGDNADIEVYPAGDGGEGTLESLSAQYAGSMRRTSVCGPLGLATDARWYLADEGTAIIELASAAGLPLVPPGAHDIMHAGTKGVGQLIKAAYSAGCRRFIIALGGSASNDAGLGALMAMGLRAYTATGEEITDGCGASLAHIARVDVSALNKYAGCTFTCLADVDSTFMDAPRIYGPQKGAGQAEIETLTAGMRNFARVTLEATGKDISSFYGSGAAGGTGGAFACYLGAENVPGAEAVLTRLDFNGASLVVTGEGRMDAQTLCGKLPYAVMLKAKRAGARVTALTGKADDTFLLLQSGFDDIRDICPEQLPHEVKIDPRFCLDNIQSTAKALAKELN